MKRIILIFMWRLGSGEWELGDEEAGVCVGSCE